jgi:hypothetical protein
MRTLGIAQTYSFLPKVIIMLKKLDNGKNTTPQSGLLIISHNFGIPKGRFMFIATHSQSMPFVGIVYIL